MKMTRRLLSTIAAIGAAILSMAFAPDARAEKRVALVVGNSSYQNVPQLPNPSRDANSVAQLFKDAGFDTVDVAINVGNLEFKRAIRKFEADSDQADIAVVYYAGHGLEIGGTNFLIPVDARLASDRDAEDEAITLERLVSSADGAKRLRVVVLDACRDNPFTSSMRRERKGANRAIASGLGKVEPTSTDTLIAYAAKAGSTAEDGEGQHSPFTTAILKNLTVPGLDIRLAFGRIRDDVMKSTAKRQEPFVYGSLGGGNISLVPAPVQQTAPVGDIKADYDLVAKIGTRRAWEVFLSTYKTGFYADLARVQMTSLTDQVPAPAATTSGNVAVASVGPNVVAPGREPTSKEALDWDKIKATTDQSALQKFIQRYPDSPLSITAQQRMDVLNKAAAEREAKARADREAAMKAIEEARIQAEQRKAEIAAAKKRDDDERRAKAAEADQKAKAAEAEQKAAEAKRKAEEAGRTKEASEAARLREESEKQARQAEDARTKAQQASATEAACMRDQDKFQDLNAKTDNGSTLADMQDLARSVTCDRVKPQIANAIGRLKADAAKRAAAMPNSPELVRAAQIQLARIGCANGKPDGTLNAATKTAFGRYMTIKGQSGDINVTEAVVAELTKQTGLVCALDCKAGEIAKGDICVAAQKSTPVASRRKKDLDDDDDVPVRRKEAPQRRQADRDQPRQSAPAPRARQEARAPSYGGGGGGGGGGHAMIGVGF
jgi:caspase domain-containing protein